MQMEFPWDEGSMRRDLEEIRDHGLQGHDHTYGIETTAIEQCFIRAD